MKVCNACEIKAAAEDERGNVASANGIMIQASRAWKIAKAIRDQCNHDLGDRSMLEVWEESARDREYRVMHELADIFGVYVDRSHGYAHEEFGWNKIKDAARKAMGWTYEPAKWVKPDPKKPVPVKPMTERETL